MEFEVGGGHAKKLTSQGGGMALKNRKSDVMMIIKRIPSTTEYKNFNLT